jgi:predicted ATP-binding protein involved in virulence
MPIKKQLAYKWKTPYFDQKLSSISFNEVGLRGVKDVSINFNYPITAIAGANGIGKTTILQLIACLYHNKDKTHKPYRFSNSKKAMPYYTFSDFFIHFRGEQKSENAKIEYNFFQKGKEKNHTLTKGKKWNDYRLRPNRHCDFYGVSRVIPAHEFNTFKNTFSSSGSAFSQESLSDESTAMIRTILNKPLKSVDVNSSDKIVNFKLNSINLDSGLSYSNFNMGAGEEVIIAMISRINELPNSSIVLIEELELGLHPKAQKVLMEKLFAIVYAKRLQLIFTTHSPFLFNAMPPEGKILLKKFNEQLEVIYEPSTSMAFSELVGESPSELTVYVEDHIAKMMLQELLSSKLLKRINLVDVGSKENVVRMVGAHHRNPLLGKAVGIADGDLTHKELTNWYKKYVLKEGELFEDVFEINSSKMFRKFAGTNAPEVYMLEKLKRDEAFMRVIDDSDEFKSFILYELELKDLHNLFYVISDYLCMDEMVIKSKIIGYVMREYREDFEALALFVKESLAED